MCLRAIILGLCRVCAVGQFESIPTPLYTIRLSGYCWLQPDGPIHAEGGASYTTYLNFSLSHGVKSKKGLSPR